MGFKNLKQLDFILKNSFFKIKKDIKKLNEVNKEIVKALSVIRESLLELNAIKKKLEDLENSLEKKDSGELEESKKRGFISRFFLGD